MTMGPGGPGGSDELRIPLRIDTSQVEQDLRSLDTELARLERRVVQTFNRLTNVRRGTSARAENLGEVRKELSGLGDDDLRAAMLHLRGPMEAYGRRAQQLAAQAAAGRGTLPPTAQQAVRSQAAERLAQIQRQGQGQGQGQGQQKPVEITARARFFDDMRQGLMRGLPSVATSTATGGLPGGASSAARLIMGLLGEAPLAGGVLGGAALVGGATIAITNEQASFQRQQAALASALVGGPALGESRTRLGLAIMNAGQQYGIDQGAMQKIAQGVADYGTASGAIAPEAATAAAYGKAYQLPQNTVNALVGLLGTSGGLNPQQISQTLRDLATSASAANLSMAQLVNGASALAAVNPVAARNAFSLAAIQKYVGATSGINAGQLMAGVLGSTGASELMQAGVLGMSADRFEALRHTKAGAAHIFDTIAATTRQFSGDATGMAAWEAFATGTGLIPSNLPANQQAALFHTFRTAPRGQAYQYYQQLTRARPSVPSPHQLTQPQTSPWENFWIGFGNLFTSATNAPHPSGAAPVGPPTGGAPIPLMFPIAAGGSPAHHPASVSHTLKVDVTVKDQRGNTLGHQVDHTRVVTGAPRTLRPPATPPSSPRSASPHQAEWWNPFSW